MLANGASAWGPAGTCVAAVDANGMRTGVVLGYRRSDGIHAVRHAGQTLHWREDEITCLTPACEDMEVETPWGVGVALQVSTTLSKVDLKWGVAYMPHAGRACEAVLIWG